jgi:hypothetical protein
MKPADGEVKGLFVSANATFNPGVAVTVGGLLLRRCLPARPR